MQLSGPPKFDDYIAPYPSFQTPLDGAFERDADVEVWRKARSGRISLVGEQELRGRFRIGWRALTYEQAMKILQAVKAPTFQFIPRTRRPGDGRVVDTTGNGIPDVVLEEVPITCRKVGPIPSTTELYRRFAGGERSARMELELETVRTFPSIPGFGFPESFALPMDVRSGDDVTLAYDGGVSALFVTEGENRLRTGSGVPFTHTFGSASPVTGTDLRNLLLLSPDYEDLTTLTLEGDTDVRWGEVSVPESSGLQGPSRISFRLEAQGSDTYGSINLTGSSSTKPVHLDRNVRGTSPQRLSIQQGSSWDNWFQDAPVDLELVSLEGWGVTSFSFVSAQGSLGFVGDASSIRFDYLPSGLNLFRVQAGGDQTTGYMPLPDDVEGPIELDKAPSVEVDTWQQEKATELTAIQTALDGDLMAAMPSTVERIDLRVTYSGDGPTALDPNGRLKNLQTAKIGFGASGTRYWDFENGDWSAPGPGLAVIQDGNALPSTQALTPSSSIWDSNITTLRVRKGGAHDLSGLTAADAPELQTLDLGIASGGFFGNKAIAPPLTLSLLKQLTTLYIRKNQGTGNFTSWAPFAGGEPYSQSGGKNALDDLVDALYALTTDYDSGADPAWLDGMTIQMQITNLVDSSETISSTSVNRIQNSIAPALGSGSISYTAP